MAEPLARMESGSEGVLAEAARRLERAVQALEAALAAGRAVLAPPSAQVVELETARRRNRELESAAGEASQALGRAMAQVRRALQDDEAHDPQASLFDLGLLDEALQPSDGDQSPLESGPGLSDDQDGTEADALPARKEPTP